MKERLTGAIILVVLIVLLVPELLSGPKGPSAPVPPATAPNSSEEPPLRSYTINLGEDSHSRGEPAGSATGSNGPAMPQPSGPEQPTAQPSGAVASGTDTGAGQASGTQASAASPNGVQPNSAATTGEPANGAATSSALPVPHTAKATASASKPTAPTQKPATASQKLAAASQKPTKAHPSAAATAATTSESGWAVQLGVFASRENAERLALEVRVKGFKASVSPVTSGSRKLYRVRVGPTPDRSAAQELQERLKASGRPGGTVVPYS